MKKLILLISMLGIASLYAQKEKAENYISKYKELAIAEMMRSGVPASITLAQGILESKSGESDLAKVSNNHFGIKCKTEWTGPKTYHDDDEKGECFRVYESVEQSFADHSDFLKTRPHYAFLFDLDPTDTEGWAMGLKKAGYATLSTYPQKLLKLVNEYNLQQYSLDALARLQKTDSDKTKIETDASPGEMVSAKPLEEKIRVTEPVADPTPIIATSVVTERKQEPTVTKPIYPAGIFSINHTKVVYVNAGRSLLSLALQYDLPLNKLFEYNELTEMDILDKDRLLFLEKKSKKGAMDYHLVAQGESLHDICQLEGIRMDSLLEYNKLDKQAHPASGEKLNLKPVPASSTKPGK